LLLLLSSIFTFNACKKDELTLQDKKTETKSAQTLKGFRQYAWSPKEQSFFSIAPRVESKGAKLREGGEMVFHPFLTRAYNEIAKQNERDNFVEGMVTKVGYPVWDKSHIFYNNETRENLVLIPFVSVAQKKTMAFIAVTETLTEKTKRFVINTMSRQELLDTQHGEAEQKRPYTREMINYDKALFGTEDRDLREAYCSYNNPSHGGANGPNGPPAPPAPPAPPVNPDCEWKIIQFCTNRWTQTNWIGGTVKNDKDPLFDVTNSTCDLDKDGIPNNKDYDTLNGILPIGDHDHDGVQNKDDADWGPWYDQNGDHDGDCIPNKDDQDWNDFNIRFPHWVNQMRDFYPPELDEYDNYDDFWEDYEDDFDNGPGGGIHINWSFLNDIGNWFGDFFGGIGDFFGDLWDDFHDWWDWLTGPSCPHGDDDGGGRISSNNTNHNSTKGGLRDGDIECDFFYVKDCPGDSQWFHGFDEMIPCPECGDDFFNSPDAVKKGLVTTFINKYHLNPSLISDLMTLSGGNGGCSPYVPAAVFDECLKSKYIESLAIKLELSVEDATTFFNLHEQLMNNDQSYEDANLGFNLPELGTTTWAETVLLSEPAPNSQEKALILLFPFPALVIYSNSTKAFNMEKQVFGSVGHNTKSDAFRHCFFQAINTTDVTATITTLFANAHESATPQSLQLEKDMDVFNNGVGINIGSSNIWSTDEEIKDKVLEALNDGLLKYLDPLDVHSNIIPGVTHLIPTNQ
jgi:hypothetical protein